LGLWLLLLAAAPQLLQAQKYYTYVGELGPDHVTLAWGTTGGDNTIGRSSSPIGTVKVRVGSNEVTVSDRNWVVVRGLQPDTEYDYQISLGSKKIAQASVRTWASKASKLRFFVIGDYGTGDSRQTRTAQAMQREFERLQGDNPVRFVLTTGDNIYGSTGFSLRYRNTGDKDAHWDGKFFDPYGPVLAHVPFYPTLGNHDGNETESRGDLVAYLDNFFFPSPQPARYYRFSYGGLADFFALDSTTNSESGPSRPAFAENNEQQKWLARNLAESRVPWKIPYFHHPPFNAGPRHPAARSDLAHWLKIFESSGVKVVFNGHEHNFQFSVMNSETGGVRYVVSGSGGELREGDIRGNMEDSHIEGWAPVNQFLSVEIEGKEMRIRPISYAPFEVLDRNGGKIGMPLRVTVP
jgi:hypothetical protein